VTHHLGSNIKIAPPPALTSFQQPNTATEPPRRIPVFSFGRRIIMSKISVAGVRENVKELLEYSLETKSE
jgi:hypothetical protein